MGSGTEEASLFGNISIKSSADLEHLEKIGPLLHEPVQMCKLVK
jgi:hypothetical protein